MLRPIKKFVRWLLSLTPFELRRRLPGMSVEPLDLVMANFNARGEGLTVVQVGASDGISNDPIYHYVTQPSTRAILIEPNPLAFALLKKTHADRPNVTLVQAAIGEQDGEAHLYRVKDTGTVDSGPFPAIGVASFYPGHLKHHGKKSGDIERITVPCRTLTSLVTELGLKKIDLLQVDAEGFDAEVVRMALKMPVLPGCINFEHIHLKREDRYPLFDLLKAKGYALGYDDWNILAIQQTLLERLKKLGT